MSGGLGVAGTTVIQAGSPYAYRIVGPSVVADASGGLVQVNANVKFTTNIPLTHYMVINRILYFLTWTKLPVADGTNNVGNWSVGMQITEAQSRTIANFADPTFVDEWTITVAPQKFLTSGISNPALLPGLLDRFLVNQWASVAQTLNAIAIVQPNNSTSNGPNLTISPVLEFFLLPLSENIRAYLTTRLQITGQA